MPDIGLMSASMLPPEPTHTHPGHWRYLICHPATGKILDELPLRCTSLPARISQDSQTTFELDLSHPQAGSSAAAVTDPRNVPLVAVLRNDVPAWAGIIQGQRGLHTLQLSAVSLEGWFKRRTTNGFNTPAGAQTIQHVVEQLVLEANFAAAPGVDINLEWIPYRGHDWWESVPFGSKAPDRVEYPPDQTVPLLDALVDQGERMNFEFACDFAYLPAENRIQPRIRVARNLGTIGTFAAVQPEARWELGPGGAGGNLVEADLSVDAGAGKYATWLRTLGSGEGESKLQTTDRVDAEREQRIGVRLEAFTRHSNVKSPAQLDVLASRDYAELRYADVFLTAKARLDLPPVWGTFGLGDLAQIVIEDTPRFPRKPWGSPGLSIRTRLHGWVLNPTTDTIELLLDDEVKV